jgi:hypothetical protein
VVETVADDFRGDNLEILEINHHIALVAIALAHRNVDAVSVAVQVLTQPLMVGKNVRGIEFYGLGYSYHQP